MTQIATTDLAEIMARFKNDPLGFVLWAFPWGEPGTQLENEYPDRWQIAVLKDIGAAFEANDRMPEEERIPVQVAVASGHGIGKAQSLDIEVDTPSGRRRWGDLQVGDYLFGKNGQPTQIKARHDHENVKMYRVHFDDGSYTDCCEDHLWTVRGRNERRIGSDWLTISTKEIIKRGVKRKNGKSQARQWEIPKSSSVVYPSKNVPVNPYTLGVWLGDGVRNSSRIASADHEVIERLQDIGEVVRKEKSPFMYGVSMLKKKLVSLGVCDKYSYQKSIPVSYMENDAVVRAEVLRGLLDTDGETAKHGSIVFNSTSKALVEDVIWLARSLGGKARMQPTTKKTTHRDCHRATITMPHGFQSFYIRRKQDRVQNVEDRYLSRWIDRIEELPRADAMCVTVDAKDSLYLANDFIVTHNTAFMAWIDLWFMSTNIDPQIVTTANTLNQLTTKTWRELSKWHKLMIHEHLFEWTATKFYLKERPETWCSNAIPWSKHTTESFAGTHAEAVLYKFDEGSAIEDAIYDVSEGAMTSGRCLWVVFGNPTRNTGRFRACFGKFRHRWITRSIDSRTSRKAGVDGKKKIQQWIEDYGIDSDFVRIRVLGKFPRQASNQLIAEADVDHCINEFESLGFEMFPVSVCVDVARFGDDMTTIGAYQGSKTHELKGYKQKNVVETATLAAECYRFHRGRIPAHIQVRVFVDDIGVGGGVTDILKTWGIPTTGVNSGARAQDPDKFVNVRAEMWWRGREAIIAGFELPDEPRLKEDLINIEYFMTANQKIQLEAVKDLKLRDLPSPDFGTNFVLQFAYPQILDIIDTTVPSRQRRGSGSTTMQKRREQGYGVRKKSIQRT